MQCFRAMCHGRLVGGHVFERQRPPGGQLPNSPGEQHGVVVQLFRGPLTGDDGEQRPIEMLGNAGKRDGAQRRGDDEATGVIGDEVIGPFRNQRLQRSIHRRRG